MLKIHNWFITGYFLILMLGLSSSWATPYTWTGAVNSDWNNAGNWSPNVVPGVSDAVTIDLAGGANISLNAAQSVNSLILGGVSADAMTIVPGTGGTLSIGSGGISSPSGSLGIHAINSPVILSTSMTISVVNSSGVILISGTISGAGSITKTGAGRLSLNGSNTYTGTTTVAGGLLSVMGSLGSGNVTVLTGGTLSGSGTILGPVQVNDGGGISAGDVNPGTLHVGPLTIAGETSAIKIRIGTVSDQIVVTGNLTNNGVVHVIAAPGFVHGLYTMITFTGILTNNILTMGTNPGGTQYTFLPPTATEVQLQVGYPPVITSNGGSSNAAVSVTENSTAVTTVVATDGDATTPTYALNGGADAALFTINATTGALSFLVARDFEAPGDVGANNVYDVIVRATDGAISDNQAIAVTVTNVTETAITITISGQTKTYGDVLSLGTTAYTITSGVLNNGGDITGISLTSVGETGTASAGTYAINSSVAIGPNAANYTITFVPGTLTVNPRAIIVTASALSKVFGDADPALTYTVTTGALQNSDVFSGALSRVAGEAVGTYAINQNTFALSADYVLTYNSANLSITPKAITITAADRIKTFGDVLALGTTAYTITSGALNSAGDITGVTLASAGAASPATAGTYAITPSQAVGPNAANYAITYVDGMLTVNGTNGAPTDINLSNSTVAENAGANVVVGALSSTDPDAGNTFTYTLVAGTGGDDNASFNLSGGNLRATASFDYETKSSYTVRVRTTDQGGLSFEKAFALTVTNVNEAPSITSAATVNGAENQTAAITVTSTDPDVGATKTFSITGGADQAKFSIVAGTGVLTFISAPNFEIPTDVGADNTYNVTVQVTDGVLTASQNIAVTVTNVTGILISSNGGGATAAVNVAENSTAVTTVIASDEGGAAPVYSLSGGADQGFFLIDPSTGALTFSGAPNFETPSDANADGDYVVEVTATGFGGVTDVQTITVTVTNVSEAPFYMTLSPMYVSENNTPGILVGTLSSMDPDVGNSFTYSLVAGAGDNDNGQFLLSGNSLKLNVAADYETQPFYYIRIRTTDQGGLNFEHAFSISVMNMNEAPVITSNGGLASASVNVVENQTAVTNVTATDMDGTTPTFMLNGGTDVAFFTINTTTGELAFLSARDFETKSDDGANNTYEVIVQATDGTMTVDQAITVTLTNVNEAPTITSTATLNAPEKQTSVITVASTDPDAGATATYSITGGADAAKFSIVAGTGGLTFQTAPNFDIPTDAGTDNVYEVTVQVSDGALTASQNVAVTVTNVSEIPITITASAQSKAYGDVQTLGTTAYTITSGALNNAGDITGVTLASSGAIGTSAAGVYAITASAAVGPNVANYAITYVSGALTVNKKALSVTADNKSISFGAVAPAFTASYGGFVSGEDVSVLDNTGFAFVTTYNTGDAVGNYPVTVSLGTATDGNYSFSPLTNGNLNVGLKTITITANTQSKTYGDALTLGTTGYTITSGTLDNAGDITGVTLASSGAAGTASVGTYAITPSAAVGPNAANYMITYAPGPLTIDPRAIAVTATAQSKVYGATDPSLTYAVITGALQNSDAFSGSLSRVAGESAGTYAIVQNTMALGANYLLTYNTSNFAITPKAITITASAQSKAYGDVLTLGTTAYTITSGALNNAGDITGVTLASAGAVGTAPTGTYAITPSVAVGPNAANYAVTYVDGSLSVQANATPVITNNSSASSVTVSIPENSIQVDQFNATDADAGAVLNYSISGADATRFTITSSTGILKFTVAPDYEAPRDANSDGTYQVNVTVTDETAATDVQALTVMVTNLNDNTPVISSNGGATSASISLLESSRLVATIQANDLDGDPLTYSIIGGDDSSLFALDSYSGALTFLVPPVFASPNDRDADNIFQVNVGVSDGVSSALQTIQVTVTPKSVSVALVAGSQIRIPIVREVGVQMEFGSWMDMSPWSAYTLERQFLTVADSAIMLASPMISATGALTLQPKANASGTSLFRIRACKALLQCSNWDTAAVVISAPPQFGSTTLPRVLNAPTDMTLAIPFMDPDLGDVSSLEMQFHQTELVIHNDPTSFVSESFNSVGQSFQAPSAGLLAKIEVFAKFPQPYVHVLIGNTDQNIVADFYAPVSQDLKWQSILVGQNVALVAGQSYTLMFQCAGMESLQIAIDEKNSYANGSLYVGSAISGKDLKFRIHTKKAAPSWATIQAKTMDSKSLRLVPTLNDVGAVNLFLSLTDGVNPVAIEVPITVKATAAYAGLRAITQGQAVFLSSLGSPVTSLPASIQVRVKVEGPGVDTLIAMSTDPQILVPVPVGNYVLGWELYSSVNQEVISSGTDSFDVNIPQVQPGKDQAWSMVGFGANPMEFSSFNSASLVFRWSENGYMDRTSLTNSQGGFGYWYWSQTPDTLTMAPLATMPMNLTIPMNLDTLGWNMVANPWSWSVNPRSATWSSGSATPEFWEWVPELGDYKPATELKPFEAYWVNASDRQSLLLDAQPYLPSGTPLAKQSLARYTSSKEWTVQVKLMAAGKSDEYNSFGISPLAKAGMDALDGAEPPQGFGDLVKLSLGFPKRPLSRDMQGSGAGTRWTVRLNSSTDRMGSVVFEGLESQRLVWMYNGEVQEIHNGVPLAVELRKSGSVAYVEELGPQNQVALQGGITDFQASFVHGKVNLSFAVPFALSGEDAEVTWITPNGARIAQKNLGLVASGYQQYVLDATQMPAGVAWIRLRIGNQQIAKPVVVSR